MSITLRIFLVLGSVLSAIFFLSKIKKNRLRIDHSIFWMVFCVVLIVLAVIPNSAFAVARILNIESPANVVYLIVIAMLMFKQFTNTILLSRLNERVSALTHALAIHEHDECIKNEQQTEQAEAVNV